MVARFNNNERAVVKAREAMYPRRCYGDVQLGCEDELDCKIPLDVALVAAT